MDSKTQFLSDKKLLQWWTGVVEDARFNQVMMHLKAATFEGNPTVEQQSGISQFINSMESIVNPDEGPTVYASPGLNHNLEITRKTAEPEKEKPSKKK
jgi:hypothetical protein